MRATALSERTAGLVRVDVDERSVAADPRVADQESDIAGRQALGYRGEPFGRCETRGQDLHGGARRTEFVREAGKVGRSGGHQHEVVVSREKAGACGTDAGRGDR